MAHDIGKAIKEELAKISGAVRFDSHYIIKQLLKNHTDEYLSYAASIGVDNKPKSAATIHGLLAQ